MEGDSTDVGSKRSKGSKENKSKENNKKEQGILSGDYTDEVYSMDYKKMGKCIILNHKTYSCGLKDRPESDGDATALKRFFDRYNLDVEIYTDRKVKEIDEILERVKNENHSDASCFVLCVLTHGNLDRENKEEILFAYDSFYPTEKLFSTFLGDNCPYLAGKPKLFFIQACRGGNFDKGVNTFFQLFKKRFGPLLASGFENISEPLMCRKIPLHADYLIAYSTVSGYVSFKTPSQGSWFIQALCQTLEERSEKLDLVSILTIVCRKVAYNYESQTEVASENNMKQVPSLYSTLTRRFEFPKE